jgi:16S rRNA processing protein RimM
MIDLSGSILLGTIAKTHGFRGHVIVRLNRFSAEDILKMETVFIEIDGLPVPFFVEDFEERTSDTLLISLEDIHDEKQAKELTGSDLYLPKRNIISKEYPSQASVLLGFQVIDNHAGEIGVISEIIDIEMNPLLRVVKDRKEILVPFHPDFINRIDKKKKKIFIETPPGLIS